MSDISFTPEDFDSVLTVEDLSAYMEKIIVEIRSGNVGLSQINEQINKLQSKEIYGIDANSSVNQLLTAYKTVQAVSMSLRSLLAKYVNLEVYDSIAYAFYFNGQRFSTENLNADWMFVTSKGELRLSLDKAVEDLKKDIAGTAKEKVADIFNRHYARYMDAIVGMYKGHAIGSKQKGSRLNRGHIAEAYETHIASHHSQAYNLYNELNTPLSTMDKMVYVLELETKGDEYWASHETPDEAWRHIRGAMGTQRGTVAGDVGRFQVKQGTSSDTNIYSSQVRLASLSTLRNGINAYCDILNPNIAPNIIARKIAMYMSEPVAKNERNIKAYAANKYLSEEISKLGKLRHI